MYLSSEKESIDVTEWFVRLWANAGFETLMLDDFRNEIPMLVFTEAVVLVVHYEFKNGEDYRVLYENSVIYPPYKRHNDPRIPKTQEFEKDLETAYLSETDQTSDDEYSRDTPEDDQDVSDLLWTFRGPGPLFYDNTACYRAMSLYATFIRKEKRSLSKYLIIEWSDGTMDKISTY